MDPSLYARNKKNSQNLVDFVWKLFQRRRDMLHDQEKSGQGKPSADIWTKEVRSRGSTIC